MKFETSLRVRWGDMDNLGHVNNATYFSYFEQARIEWLDEIGVCLSEATGPVVMTASATYLRPVVYPADITILMTMHTPKRSSFMVDYVLSQEETVMVEGQTKIVWIDYKAEKSVPIPEKIRELIETRVIE